MGTVNAQAIGQPEFINMTQLSPLISKGECKVCYVGKNRNGSFINKETLTKMGQTLPGSPIVGYYNEEKEDFVDHGEQLVIDGTGFHRNCLTKPYGFVAPDAKVWFQKFQEQDDFSNVIEREYLMTEVLLWTGQFPECASALNGKPHSMELDEGSLDGHWAEDVNSHLEFFIIDDAVISKLCILGDDVEPCFEGANFNEPTISSNFSLSIDEDNIKTMFTMVKELKEIYNKEKGGTEELAKANLENFENSQDKIDETVQDTFQNNIEDVSEEFANKEQDDEEEDKSEDNKDSKSEDTSSNSEDEKDKEDYSCGDNDKDKFEDEDSDKEGEYSNKDQSADNEYALKYQEISQKYEELQTQFAAFKEDYDALVQFKNEIEDSKKDALISEFYMLSDEDKKDVIDNKSKYSLDEIEAKLSVICHRKKVNFGLEKEKDAPTVYNLNQTQASNVPAWIQAVQETQSKMK